MKATLAGNIERQMLKEILKINTGNREKGRGSQESKVAMEQDRAVKKSI